MEMQTAVPLLEEEWELDTGFFGKLREGQFDSSGLERVIHLLEKVDTGKADVLNRRFVALTWYIPIFMTWQRERHVEKGGNPMELDRATDRLQGLLNEILGIP